MLSSPQENHSEETPHYFNQTKLKIVTTMDIDKKNYSYPGHGLLENTQLRSVLTTQRKLLDWRSCINQKLSPTKPEDDTHHYLKIHRMLK